MLPSAFAPISRLPAEILAQIFQTAITLAETEFSSNELQVWTITQVCPHWQSVVIEFPNLWSSLVFTSVGLTTEMLRRSKASSLVVKADFHRSDSAREAVCLALRHSSRIRILHIRASWGDFEELASAMDEPAPILESIHFANERWDWGSVLSLPQSLFKDDTPRLRYFTARGLMVPWGLPLLRGLTHLEIRDGIYPPSLAEFRAVLSNCPALSTLIIVKCLPECRARELQDQPQVPVSLPHLSHLQFGDYISDCDAAIHNVVFPPTTNIVLWCEVVDNVGPIQLLGYLSELAARCGGVSPFGSLHIVCDHIPHWLTFRAWKNPHENPRMDPLLDFTCVGSPTQPAQRAAIIHVVCERLALSQLVRLEIDFSHAAGLGTSQVDRFWIWPWPNLSGQLKNLQVLTVRTPYVGPLLSSLKPTSRLESEKLTSGEMSLPGLRELTLCGALFGDQGACDHLWECLVLRRDNKSGIETLRLVDCTGLSVPDVARLVHIVADIKWDGFEQELEDDTGYDGRSSPSEDGRSQYFDGSELGSL
jgi:hypothetical protein